MAKGARLKADPIVGILVTDPNDPPDVVAIAGYVGPSSRRKHSRLYLNLNFSTYVDIPDGAVEHYESLGSRNEPLRGSVIWISRETATSLTVTSTSHASAGLLEGKISDALMRDASPRLLSRRPPTVTPTAVSQCVQCP